MVPLIYKRVFDTEIKNSGDDKISNYDIILCFNDISYFLFVKYGKELKFKDVCVSVSNILRLNGVFHTKGDLTGAVARSIEPHIGASYLVWHRQKLPIT